MSIEEVQRLIYNITDGKLTIDLVSVADTFFRFCMIFPFGFILGFRKGYRTRKEETFDKWINDLK